MVEHALTRRNFLTNSATAVAGIATGAAVAHAVFAVIPDADLIQLGDELDSAWTAERAVYAATAAEGDVPPEHERERAAASALAMAVVERIGRLQATTLAGFCVKARATSWCHCGETIEDHTLTGIATTDMQITSSILRDLLSLAGA